MPSGVYQASLGEVVTHFGGDTSERQIASTRLERIYHLAAETGHLKRFAVFGSFITSKEAPNDVDIFIIMDDEFDVSRTDGDTAILFDHPAAQSYFGASVFWVRSMAALGGEDDAIGDWMITRSGKRRGIVEIIEENL